MTIRAARTPLLLALEVAWGWPLAALAAWLFSGGQADGPSILGVAIVVGGAAALMSALARFELELNPVRVIGVAATLVAVGAALALEYGSVLGDEGTSGAAFGAGTALVALWLRGVLRLREAVTIEAVGRSALGGVLPVAIAAAGSPPVNGADLFGELAVVYVPLVLLTLGVHRAGEPDRPLASLAPQWGAVTVAALVGGGLLALVAATIDPGSFGFLGPITAPLRAGAEAVARVVFAPVFAALGWLFRLLPDFRLPESRPPELPERPPVRPEENNDDGWFAGIPVQFILNVLLALTVALFLLLGLAMVFYRLRRSLDEGPDETENEREGGVAGDIADLLGSLGRRFRRGAGAAPSAVAIRRLYAEMLRDAAALGLERPPSVTPVQFAPALVARYGDPLPGEITAAFVESRYGGREVAAPRARELEQRWRARPRAGEGR